MAEGDPDMPRLIPEGLDEDEEVNNEMIQNWQDLEMMNAHLLRLKIDMYTKFFQQQQIKEDMAPRLFAYCLKQKEKLSRTSDDDSDDDSFKEVLIEVPKRSLEETAPEPPASAAFHNDVILATIGSFLSIPDLRSARVVNKKWCETFTSQIQRRKPLMITSPECPAAEALIQRRARGDNVNISMLVVIATPLTCPTVQNVAEVFGKTISGIVIDDCSPSGHNLASLLGLMTSLEYIDLRLANIDPLPASVPQSLLDTVMNLTPDTIFSTLKVLHWEDVRPIKSLIFFPLRFPNLRTLRLECSDLAGIGLYRFGAKPWLSLQEFYLEAPDKGNLSPIMTAFRKTRPTNLIKLKISNVAKNERDLKSIASFLKCGCAQNLEVISLLKKENLIHASSSTPNKMFTMSFPKLESVKYDFSLSDMILLAQDYAPKLTTIDASDCSVECWFDFFCGVTRGCITDKPNIKVTTLRLGYVESVCLRKFSVIFPNLTCLDVPRTDISEEAMRTIFRDFPNLQDLRIRKGSKQTVATSYAQCKIGDSTLLGIDESKIQEVLAYEQPITSQMLERLQTHPCIGDLKALRSFTIDTRGFYNPSELFFTFLRHGLLPLPELTTFTLPFVSDENNKNSMIDQIKEIFKHKNPSVSILIPSLEEQYIKLSWSNPNSGEHSEFLSDLIKRM